ncbi:RNA-directed DNA polymerase (Reverse transcriptase), partial [Trifolium medium]|nr:RNA-directed DNA polymerase (Reverse transcriptase) [Trifolium medium]
MPEIRPIIEYLENPTGNADRKVKYRALSYIIIGNELFKKTAEGVLLKCLSEAEAYLAISDVHSGACGSHQASHKMKWPTSSKNHRYIIVGIDYFTKWIEAIPLPNVDQEAVINFIQNHIIYRFGIPESITTDQGSVFVGRKMQDFAEQTGFRLLTSTSYYAQANGQVEAANKCVIGLIKKHIAQKPRNWNKTLDQVLWAYRNSPKESTKSTPFRLTYGHDAVLPAEICLQSVRIQKHMEIPSDHYWNMMLDELVDLDEERLQALDVLTRQKERIAKAYNKKVKSKTFNVGDLVWKVILPMDKKDRVLGKWSPNWEGPFRVIQCFSNGAYEIEELTLDKYTLSIN